MQQQGRFYTPSWKTHHREIGAHLSEAVRLLWPRADDRFRESAVAHEGVVPKLAAGLPIADAGSLDSRPNGTDSSAATQIWAAAVVQPVWVQHSGAAHSVVPDAGPADVAEE